MPFRGAEDSVSQTRRQSTAKQLAVAMHSFHHFQRSTRLSPLFGRRRKQVVKASSLFRINVKDGVLMTISTDWRDHGAKDHEDDMIWFDLIYYAQDQIIVFVDSVDECAIDCLFGCKVPC
jgi:hypothetical protein